jgi:two-component system, OmpR family, phosphate regulon sensor histidine kinase PhoR
MVLLMLVAIVAVIAFQAYWLIKTYQEEKFALKMRIGFVFRETFSRLQASKLRLDTNTHIRARRPGDMTRTVNVLRTRTMESNEEGDRTMIYRETGPGEVRLRDSASIENQHNDRLFYLLLQVDSLQDSITLKEVETGFSKLLKEQRLDVEFAVNRQQLDKNNLPPLADDRILIGIQKPASYGYEILNENTVLLKQLSTQILFSFFIMAVTLISFTTLYRNLQAQKRLTQLKNDFISNITHELKTPIATVSVAIEAMQNFNVLQDPQRAKEYLDISAGELQRLSLLVDKVLKLSMFEKQEIALNKQHVDLKALIEEVITSLRLQIEKFHAEISLHFSGSDFFVFADRLHITSVLYNLFDNALKYSNHHPQISVELKKECGETIMSIVDNGIGIPPEYQEKIFEQFFRVPSGDLHNVKGYGLGLSYVAYVIRQHGGDISVHSKENEGSTFTIKLPVSNG